MLARQYSRLILENNNLSNFWSLDWPSFVIFHKYKEDTERDQIKWNWNFF